MHIISKAYQSDVLRYAKSYLLNGRESCKGDDIIKGQDSIWTIFPLQQLHRGLKRPLIVDFLTDHKTAIDRNPVFLESLQIAMLTTFDHIKMVRTANKGDATTARIYQVLRSLLGSNVAISCHTREFLRQTGAPKKHQRDPHL